MLTLCLPFLFRYSWEGNNFGQVAHRFCGKCQSLSTQATLNNSVNIYSASLWDIQCSTQLCYITEETQVCNEIHSKDFK